MASGRIYYCSFRLYSPPNPRRGNKYTLTLVRRLY
nr:MAG TPA: hypothetical protein [Caudoviricetes sp.]